MTPVLEPEQAVRIRTAETRWLEQCAVRLRVASAGATTPEAEDGPTQDERTPR